MRPHVPEQVAARAAGEMYYSTGKPCKRSHLSKRRTATGKCVECLADACQRYKTAHPGEEARWARERRARDPRGHRAEVKRWADKNPDRVKQIYAEWRTAIPAYVREAHKKWRDENAEHTRRYKREQMRIRRGFKGTNGGSYLEADVDAIRAKQGGRCAGCGEESAKMERDHIVAVTRGGTNDPSNIQLLCKPCNISKSNHDFIEWATRKGYLRNPSLSRE